MAPPAFADINKSANDLLNRDFYHASSTIVEVKLKTPDGLSVNSKGVGAHDKKITGQIEAKKSIQKGITSTGTWTNNNLVTAKLELDDILAAGVKAEYIGQIIPDTGLKTQKGNLYFKQGAFHARAFGEFHPVNNNVHAIIDGVIHHEGFLVGGEAGFDVQKAALTKYAAAFGYQTPVYSLGVTASNSLSIFTASYYHKVNPSVEAGLRAVYNTKTSNTVAIELATKYKIDPTSFAKFKINDGGNVAVAYNTKINSGLTFGIGASFDAQHLNEKGHKIGTSFTFEG